MNSSEYLLEGLELMLYGMGSVFGFLILLVMVVGVMSRALARFPAPAPVPAARVPAARDDVDPILLAAIQAAIHQHRARRG